MIDKEIFINAINSIIKDRERVNTLESSIEKLFPDSAIILPNNKLEDTIINLLMTSFPNSFNLGQDNSIGYKNDIEWFIDECSTYDSGLKCSNTFSNDEIKEYTIKTADDLYDMMVEYEEDLEKNGGV